MKRLLIPALLCLALLTACTEQQTPAAAPSSPPAEPSNTAIEPTLQPEPEPEPYVPAGTNPLTGEPMEPEYMNNRPVAVMLNNLLDITDVPVAVFSSGGIDHWASQAAANLSASGILRPETAGSIQLTDALTMADAAAMLDGAMDMMEAREGGGWLPWS